MMGGDDLGKSRFTGEMANKGMLFLRNGERSFPDYV